MIQVSVQAALKRASSLAVILFLFMLASCASQVDYAPKTEAELDQQAQEDRVFYQGWLHPEVSKEDNDFFYHKFWGIH